MRRAVSGREREDELNTSLEEIALEQLRRCILIIMANLAFVDLSASSKEFAQVVIRDIAQRVCPTYINEEARDKAANCVISCLQWD